MKVKKCSKCKREKPLDEFYNHKNSKDGKSNQCKECMTAYRNSRREHYKNYMQDLRNTNNEHVKETRRKSWQNQDPRKRMLSQARNRSNRKNIEFCLEIEDIPIPDKCPLLEIPFITGTKGNYEQTHSIDRIDPSKGYTKDNVWVITKKANSMKNSATEEELLTFCKNILKLYNIDDDIVRSIEKSIESRNKES